MNEQRLDSLKTWLHEALHVPTEQTEVTVDHGTCNATFMDQQLYMMSEPQLPEEGDVLAEFTEADLQQDFGMADNYTITVIIRDFAGDAKKIKVGLLRWLHEQKQKTELEYDCEQNNQSTYDWFFDLNIEEKSRNNDEGIVTC